MRLRRFTAPDMPSAMEAVRQALGDEAIILSSEVDKTTRIVTLTAAVEEAEEDAPPPRSAVKPTRSGAEVLASNAGKQDWLDALAFLLRHHAVPEALAGRLVYKARALSLDKMLALQQFGSKGKPTGVDERALASLLADAYRFQPLDITLSGTRLMLVGPPGVGKTLAIAKLAAQATMARLSFAVITTDTARAGGVQQLQAFTDVLELPLHIAETPAKLAATLAALPPGARVLIDTAGCNPYDDAERFDLGHFAEAAQAEPILTLPAGMDAYEAAETARSLALPGVKRLLVTRTDMARRFGSILAAADSRRLSFAGISQSPRPASDIAALSATTLARLLLDKHLQTP